MIGEPGDIKRLTYEARHDGLYARIDLGPWRRVATRLAVLTVVFRDGRLQVAKVTVPPRKSQSKQKRGAVEKGGAATSVRPSDLEQAARLVEERLSRREGILDISASDGDLPVQSLDAADGFLVRIPGAGRVLAIKTGALARWIPGAVSLRAVVDALDEAGVLVRGADGKRTRQVVIGGGRHRFYCFKANEPEALKSGGKDIARRPMPQQQRVTPGPGHKAVLTTTRRPTWTDESPERPLGVVGSRALAMPFRALRPSFR